jgi:hypothetical protein
MARQCEGKVLILLLLVNKNSIFSLFFLLIQQLIVASSTLWIYRLSISVINKKDILLNIILFSLSLVLTYIPASISVYFLQKSKTLAFAKYVDLFSKNYYSTIVSSIDKQFQIDIEPWLVNEANRIIEECHNFIYDALSTIINNALNIIVLLIFININLSYGYFFILFLLPVTLRFFKNRIKSNSLALQKVRKDLTKHLMIGWDNITIGNQYNFQIWKGIFTDLWIKWDRCSVMNVILSTCASSSFIILNTIPVMINIVYIFYINIENTELLAGIVATFPRQIQILQHFYIFSSYLVHWHSLRPRISSFINSIKKNFYSKHFDKIIQWININIFINNKELKINLLQDLLNQLDMFSSGRVTIKGNNGSGKTTILNAIKEKYRDVAYILPSHSTLVYNYSSKLVNFSTGESIIRKLKEINSLYNNNINGYKILLLDEWDANLDQKNKILMDNVIENLSKNFLVIEVRHNK